MYKCKWGRKHIAAVAKKIAIKSRIYSIKKKTVISKSPLEKSDFDWWKAVLKDAFNLKRIQVALIDESRTREREKKDWKAERHEFLKKLFSFSSSIC